MSDLDAVIGSVSGGGLVAGIATAAKVRQIIVIIIKYMILWSDIRPALALHDFCYKTIVLKGSMLIALLSVEQINQMCRFPPFLWLASFPPFLWLATFPPFLWLATFPPFLWLTTFPPFLWLATFPPFLWLATFPPFLWLAIFPPFMWLATFLPFQWYIPWCVQSSRTNKRN